MHCKQSKPFKCFNITTLLIPFCFQEKLGDISQRSTYLPEKKRLLGVNISCKMMTGNRYFPDFLRQYLFTVTLGVPFDDKVAGLRTSILQNSFGRLLLRCHIWNWVFRFSRNELIWTFRNSYRKISLIGFTMVTMVTFQENAKIFNFFFKSYFTSVAKLMKET